jgi:hypothetical protein
VLLPLLGVAQAPLEAGIFIGLSNYQGDLVQSPTPRMSESNFAGGLMLRGQINQKWGMRGSMMYGKLSGNDANYPGRAQRGYSFETTLLEVAAIAEWEPFKPDTYFAGLIVNRKPSPYLFMGAAAAFISPQASYNGDASPNAALDRNAAYSNMQFAIPLGVGVKMDVNTSWALGLELGTRATFTDYLDGVSQAGEPGTNDWYLFGGLIALYRIK